MLFPQGATPRTVFAWGGGVRGVASWLAGNWCTAFGGSVIGGTEKRRPG